MTSSDDHESLIPSELDRPPSPFLTSAVLSGAGKASSTLKQDIDAGQVPEDEGSRQTTDPSRRTRTPTRTPASHVPLKFRVVCPYWYHFGLCEKSDDLCKYSHIVSESTERMAFMPIRSRSHACGLPLCKFRDGSVPKSTPSRVEPTAFNHVDAPQALSSSVPPQPIQQAVRPSTITHTKDVRNQGTKRQLPHWDAPTSAQKRAKFMDYDDQADSSSRGSADCRVTCFFWYHGSCGRSEDERTGFRCQYKHGLTEPPSMVQPPPGYVHRALCTRDWCPGDARDRPARRDSGMDVLGEAGSAADKEASAESKTVIITATAPPTEEWFLKGFDDVE